MKKSRKRKMYFGICMLNIHKDTKKREEKLKSIEMDILKAVEKTNQIFREVKNELNLFENSTKLVGQVVKTSIMMNRLFQQAKTNQDFSKEYQHLFSDLIINCGENNNTCPTKFAKFKGFYLKNKQFTIFV